MTTITILTEAVLANRIYLENDLDKVDLEMTEVNVYTCENIQTIGFFSELLDECDVEYSID